MYVTFVIFFFQAEDGIRDYKVTGVQTCALPISSRATATRWTRPRTSAPPPCRGPGRPSTCRWKASARGGRPGRKCWSRSEERRVGKECRVRGLAEREWRVRDKRKSRAAVRHAGH